MISFHELFDLCQGHVIVYVQSTKNDFMLSPYLVFLHSIGSVANSRDLVQGKTKR